MNKVVVTYDQGRFHIELDFDISKETLKDFLKEVAHAIPSAAVNLEKLTTEADKATETIPNKDQPPKEEKVEPTPST